MSYFKRLETIFIVIVILILGIAYGILDSQTRDANTDQSNKTKGSQQELSPISYQGIEGKNALELLKSKFSVETTSFGDLGEFVQAINGVAADNQHFWSFYVNGQQAQVGAGTYITKPSEIIEWRLEEIK